MDTILSTYSSAELANHLSADPDYRVLSRFKPETLFITPDQVPSGAGIAAVIDTETTGKETHDRVIELGIVTFAFNREDGAILGALNYYNGLEDPGMPIPEAASRVNGITDDMVAGKRLDEAAIRELVGRSELLVAHNSEFDRPKCEARMDIFKDIPWACSFRQLDWDAEGLASSKLDYVAYRLGFFFDAHRAYVDALALLNILKQPMQFLNGQSAFKGLLDCFRTPSHRIWAVNSPYETKDILKSRGYRWSDGTKPGSEKAWNIEVTKDLLGAELEWLKSTVYGNRSFQLPVDTLDEYTRFSDRNGQRARMPL